MKIKINNDQRVALVGTTGSGKTHLAKVFLRRLNRVVVIDPKHKFVLDGFEQKKRLPLIGSKFRLIYRPDRSDDDHLANFCYQLFRMENVTIYVDELSTLAEKFPEATEALGDIARTGRENHVAVWVALQRPRWVPRIFFTEAECVFLFSMRLDEDREYMAQFCGKEVIHSIEKRQFWYSDDTMISPVLMTYNDSKKYIEKIG